MEGSMNVLLGLLRGQAWTAFDEGSANALPMLLVEFDHSALAENRILQHFETMRKVYSKLMYQLQEIESDLRAAQAGPKESRPTVAFALSIKESIANLVKSVDEEYRQSRLILLQMILARAGHPSDPNRVVDIFYADISLTAQKVDRRYRQISLYFGNELRATEAERPKMREVLLLLNSATEIMRNMVYEDCMSREVADREFRAMNESLAFIQFLTDGDDTLVRAMGLHLKDCAGSDMSDLIKIKLESALEASKMYHQLVRLVDKQNEHQTDIHLQVEYRRRIATCYTHLGFWADAQLYLIGAMHIAHFELDGQSLSSEGLSQNEVKLACQRSLEEIKKVLNPESPGRNGARATQPPPTDGRRVPRNAQMQDATQEYRVDEELWLSLQTCRADAGMIRYGAAQEEIYASTSAANKKFYGGVALVTAGVAPTAGIGIAAAVALTPVMLALGPLGLIGLGVVATGMAIGGGAMVNQGVIMMREPRIRANLNKLVKEAMDLFVMNDTVAFLKKLTESFGVDKSNPLHLFTFNSTDLLSVEPDNVVTNLLSHGFRPDGIAYILNIVAEALCSGGCKGEGVSMSNTESHLKSEARRIYNTIIYNTELLNKAYELDDLIIKNSIADQVRGFFANLRGKDTYTGKMINGMPASYYEEEEIAPFAARLEEMRNSARMNYAIMDILEGPSSTPHAAQLLYEIERSPNSRFKYFEMSDHRLNTIEDLIHAFKVGVIRQSDGEVSSADVSNILVGSSMVEVESRTDNCTGTICVGDVLRELGYTLKTQSVIQRLQMFLDNDATRRKYLDKSKDPPRWSEHEMGEEARHAEFILHTLQADRNFPLVAERYFRPEYKNMLQMLYYPLVFIRVKINTEKKVFVSLDEVRNIRSTSNVVFLYSPNYKTTPDRISPVTVLRAKQCELVPDTHCVTLVSLLRQGRNLYADSLSAADESTKYRHLFDAHQHFKRAILTTSHIPNHWYIAPTADEDTVDAYLCMVQCEVRLAQYNNALKHLQQYHTHPVFTSKYLFWYLLAVASRKKHDYHSSLMYVNRAVTCVSNLGEYKSEVFELLNSERQLSLDLRAIKNLPNESVFDHVQKHFRTSPFPPQPPADHGRYNMLCLDGGGIKGIIAALLLVEIEKRAQRPISSLFHHIAGTSTGAIIAAALAIPHPVHAATPKFSAYEVLEMYADPKKAGQIFQRTGHLFALLGAKYSAMGREKLITEYYGSATFADARVNLSIMAINETIGQTLIPLTKERHSTVLLKDAAMASSAAPTYFESHRIGSDSYIDGGLKANNPSKEALLHAKQLGIAPERVHMLSIGCGDVCPFYVPHGHGILYYGAVAVSETIRQQQVEADRDMVAELGGNYDRWQILFEEPTGMDDISPPTMLNYIEHAKQFIKENNERIDKLVQRLLYN